MRNYFTWLQENMCLFEPEAQQTYCNIDPSTGEAVSRTEVVGDDSTTYNKVPAPESI